MQSTESDKSHTLVYERLAEDPRSQIESVCSWWEMPFDNSILTFKQPFGSFIFQSEREKEIYCKKNPLGLFNTVQSHQAIVSSLPSHGLLSNDEKEYIEDKVGQRFVDLWKDKEKEVRALLEEKAWFAFDLDDTLHEFRKASSHAAEAVFEAINNRYGIPSDKSKAAYSDILSRTTAGAFSDGKSSQEYRKERFLALLDTFSICLSDEQKVLDELLDIYRAVLESSLQLKCGALSLFLHLKSLGKNIAVITEGPQDAQEWTLSELGLADKVDFLATTNFFGVSKVQGLFGKVLEHLNIGAERIVYVGDSMERDVVPAAAAGIFTIHYSEGESFSLEVSPPRINTLKKLEFILS